MADVCASEGSSVSVNINGDVIQSGGSFTTNGTSNGNTFSNNISKWQY